MVYEIKNAAWKNGVTAKTDAATAARIMCELEAKGKLNAQSLVDASRPEDAPMHNDFEWDDAIAGEQWRKAQARTYIASIVYTPVQTQGEPIRMFAKLTTRGSEYTSLETILKSKDSIEALRAQAAKELESFRSKYLTILKLADATGEITSVLNKLEQTADAKGA